MNDNEILMFPIDHLNGGIASVINENDKQLEESFLYQNINQKMKMSLELLFILH